MFREQRGFMLIEVLLVLVIMGLLLPVIYSFSLVLFNSWQAAAETAILTQNTRMIIERIGPVVRSAAGIDTTGLPGVIRLAFLPVESGGKVYNCLEYGVKENGEFYYRKWYVDGSRGNRMSITSKETVRVKKSVFSFEPAERLVRMVLVLTLSGNEKKRSLHISSSFVCRCQQSADNN